MVYMIIIAFRKSPSFAKSNAELQKFVIRFFIFVEKMAFLVFYITQF